MKMLIMAMAIAVLLSGAFVIGTVDPLGIRQAPAAKPVATEEAHGEAAGGKPKTVMYTTKERVVNLGDPGTLRYLKTEVVLELSIPAKEAKDFENLKGEEMKKKQEELAAEFAPVTPALSDIITTTLSSKKAADLLTPEGKAALREDLKAKLDPAIESVAHGKKIYAVYLAQFIVQ